MIESAPRPAPAHPVVLPDLRAEPTGWRRAAEASALLAFALLLAAGVIPW